jgi:ATP-dependent Clp protease protease subunit
VDVAPVLRAALAPNDASELVIEIYGSIGESLFSDGITTQQVADALKGTYSKVTVRVNSPGGNMTDGLAIYNLLRQTAKPVRVVVDGLAASAASLIAMAGDSIEMGEGTLMMIHPAQTMIYGSSVDLRETAMLLEKASSSMADIYAARSKRDKAEVLQMMYAETWMNAQEAIDLGFADSKTGEESQVSAVAAAYNLAIFAKTPEELKEMFKVEPQVEDPKGTPKANAERLRLELL